MHSEAGDKTQDVELGLVLGGHGTDKWSAVCPSCLDNRAQRQAQPAREELTIPASKVSPVLLVAD